MTLRSNQPRSTTELFNHVEVLVAAATRDRLYSSLLANDYPTFAGEHGYRRSPHATDPDGLRLDLVLDAPDADRIDLEPRREARSWLTRWTNAIVHRTTNLSPTAIAPRSRDGLTRRVSARRRFRDTGFTWRREYPRPGSPGPP